MKTAPTGAMGISVMEKENAARYAGMPDAAATRCGLIPFECEAPHLGITCRRSVGAGTQRSSGADGIAFHWTCRWVLEEPVLGAI
jgi:hypothetical protein